jgi:hypothetical protein
MWLAVPIRTVACHETLTLLPEGISLAHMTLNCVSVAGVGPCERTVQLQCSPLRHGIVVSAMGRHVLATEGRPGQGSRGPVQRCFSACLYGGNKVKLQNDCRAFTCKKKPSLIMGTP